MDKTTEIRLISNLSWIKGFVGKESKSLTEKIDECFVLLGVKK